MYSLYGISSDFCNVTPDYKKSEEDVYTEFAKNQIKKGNGRRTLYQATIAERRSEELPSWVPDWGSAPTRMNFGEQWSATSRWLFKAGGEQTASGPKETLIVNGRTLITRGYVVQRIATMFQLGSSQSQTPNLDHFVTMFRDWSSFQRSGRPYPTGEDLETVMGSILESDQPRDTWDTSTEESLDALDIILEPEFDSFEDKNDDFLVGLVRKMKVQDPVGLKNMARSIQGRRFAVTDQGYAGLVPTKTEVGDVICILRGFAVPFILRQQGLYFILIGDCYFHGMMQGEMLDTHRAEAIRLQ
jgi:hypothetical protein